MPLEKRQSGRTYASVLADATIRVSLSKDDSETARIAFEAKEKETGSKIMKMMVILKGSVEEITKREYENRDGSSGVKYEHVYNNLRGKISAVEFFEGEYGEQLVVTIDGVALAMPLKGSFSEDLMQKFPNIDFGEEVNFVPYSLQQGEKSRKGITVYQGKGKIQSFFWDGIQKKNINGFPEPDRSKKYSKDDWHIYYIGVKNFLKDYALNNVIPKISSEEIPEEIPVNPFESEEKEWGGMTGEIKAEPEEVKQDIPVAESTDVPKPEVITAEDQKPASDDKLKEISDYVIKKFCVPAESVKDLVGAVCQMELVPENYGEIMAKLRTNG